jgi:hypothetical protein
MRLSGKEKHLLAMFLSCWIAVTILSACATARAQEPSSTAADDNLSLENKKLDIEKRKLDIEYTKLNQGWITAIATPLAIIVPILGGLLFIGQQRKNATDLQKVDSEDARKLQKIESDVAFQLKVAEFVMTSKSTWAGQERAAALRLLFPNQVSEEFVKTLRENLRLPGMAYQEKKLELFKAMAAEPDKKRDVFAIYGLLYADEEHVISEFADKWRTAYPGDAAWIEEYVERWKSSYPKGKWAKKSPQTGK